MPSVTFIPGVAGGTEQYRCRTPGEALRRRGWDVAYVKDMDEAFDADVVVFQRTVGDDAAALIRTLQARGAVVVFDIDDWFDGIPTYNPAHKIDTQADGNLSHLHDAMRVADVVTVSTPELAEGYGHLNRTVVLPNYLDPDIWTGNEKYRVPHTKIHVGYMGAFKWHGGDIDLLAPWLPAWLDRHPNVEFVAIGCGELPDHLGIRALVSPKLPNSNNWLRPYHHLPALLPWLDIGLVPLVFNRFNQAKSWIKGLEYNVCGAAAVASPTREYRTYINPGVNGLLARDWPSTLDRTLHQLPELQAGAKATAARYFIDDHIDRWVATYESLRSSRWLTSTATT